MGSRRYEVGSEIDVEKEVADKLVKNGLANVVYKNVVLPAAPVAPAENPIVSDEAVKEVLKEEVPEAPKKRGRKKK